MGRPATGQTPVRTVRIGAAWDEARANAEADGEKFADVLERLLHRYNAASARRRKRADSVKHE
jgi:hypothetical protein